MASHSFIDLGSVRAHSLAAASSLGFAVKKQLPLLDDLAANRSQGECVDRVLCLHVAAACAYGFDKGRAFRWVERERLVSALTPKERRFVELGIGDADQFKAQIEGLWALSWAIGIVTQLDFGKSCDDTFARLLPNLRDGGTSHRMRSAAQLRSSAEIIGAVDLAYCLHWATRQAQLENNYPPNLAPPYVIEERRRALEWLTSPEPWDAIALDT